MLLYKNHATHERSVPTYVIGHINYQRRTVGRYELVEDLGINRNWLGYFKKNGVEIYQI